MQQLLIGPSFPQASSSSAQNRSCFRGSGIIGLISIQGLPESPGAMGIFRSLCLIDLMDKAFLQEAPSWSAEAVRRTSELRLVSVSSLVKSNPHSGFRLIHLIHPLQTKHNNLRTLTAAFTAGSRWDTKNLQPSAAERFCVTQTAQGIVLVNGLDCRVHRMTLVSRQSVGAEQ